MPRSAIDREGEARIREALREAVRGSRLSFPEIEEALGLRAGLLTDIFSGRVELGVAHVYGVLRLLGVPPWSFFLRLMREKRSGLEANPSR